jgi:hypothetical protein
VTDDAWPGGEGSPFTPYLPAAGRPGTPTPDVAARIERAAGMPLPAGATVDLTRHRGHIVATLRSESGRLLWQGVVDLTTEED